MHNYSSNFTFEWVHLKLLFTKPQRFFKIWIQYNNNVQRIHQKLWRYRQILKLLWHTDFTSHRLAATLYFSFLIWIKLSISQLFDDLTGSSAVNPTRACRIENACSAPCQWTHMAKELNYMEPVNSLWICKGNLLIRHQPAKNLLPVCHPFIPVIWS